MSIRLIARELYRLQKEVEKLEEALCRTPHGKKAPLEEKLRIARAERNKMRDALDGQKDRLR